MVSVLLLVGPIPFRKLFISRIDEKEKHFLQIQIKIVLCKNKHLQQGSEKGAKKHFSSLSFQSILARLKRRQSILGAQHRSEPNGHKERSRISDEQSPRIDGLC
jgi:hypothetical protein